MDKCYQIKMQLFLLENISIDDLQEKVTAFIDSGFKSYEDLVRFHEKKILIRITAMTNSIR